MDWNKDSQKVHGIARKEVINYGKPAIEVANDLNSLLWGSPVYSDCTRWDQFWLEVLFKQVCVKSLFKSLDLVDELSIEQGIAYPDASERVKTSGSYVAHRALDDTGHIPNFIRSGVYLVTYSISSPNT